MLLLQTAPENSNLLILGTAFSGIALLLVLGSIWWLYFSPLKNKPDIRANVSPAYIRGVAYIFAISAFARLLSAHWDSSEHFLTGVAPGGEDFLWPPHLMLYATFFTSFIVAMLALLKITQPYRRKRIFDPRFAIRDFPFLGAIIIATLYGWASVPGDAIWHEIYGIELTAWSPPHIMLIIAAAAEPICAAGLLAKYADKKGNPTGQKLTILAVLGVALQLTMIIGTIDWEYNPAAVGGGEGFDIINARPSWLYPVVTAGLTLLVATFGKRLSGLRWGTTLTVLFSFAARYAAVGFVMALEGLPLATPLITLLGALLIDLAAREAGGTFGAVLLQAGLFTAGFLALVPLGIGPIEAVFGFTNIDFLLSALVTFAVSLAIIPAANTAAGWFARGVPAVGQNLNPAMAGD